MKVLDDATNTADLERDAELLMESILAVNRAIRRQIHEHRPAELSMQQFRALGIVHKHPNASLSSVAVRLGLTSASASKLIDSLVKREMISRTDSTEDRRVMVLELTGPGREALETAGRATLGRLAELLGSVDELDRAAVVRGMESVRRALETVEV